jgi:hypothetical protein
MLNAVFNNEQFFDVLVPMPLYRAGPDPWSRVISEQKLNGLNLQLKKHTIKLHAAEMFIAKTKQYNAAQIYPTTKYIDQRIYPT